MAKYMTVFGVDITQEAGAICGSAWVVFYIALVWFVWTRKPTTQIGRRWKAAWLIGGLSTLGTPLLMPIIFLGILLLGGNTLTLNGPSFEEILLIFSSLLGLIACTAPFSVLMSLFAIIGVYNNFRNRLDHDLDKLVPPQKEEKPNVWSDL